MNHDDERRARERFLTAARRAADVLPAATEPLSGTADAGHPIDDAVIEAVAEAQEATDAYYLLIRGWAGETAG